MAFHQLVSDALFYQCLVTFQKVLSVNAIFKLPFPLAIVVTLGIMETFYLQTCTRVLAVEQETYLF